MPSVQVFAKKTQMDVTCGTPFEVEIKVRVATESIIQICFGIEAESCFFLPENNKKKCEDPFPISPSDGYVEKKYTLVIKCVPADKYATLLSITAINTETGESQNATVSLDINCL